MFICVQCRVRSVLHSFQLTPLARAHRPTYTCKYISVINVLLYLELLSPCFVCFTRYVLIHFHFQKSLDTLYRSMEKAVDFPVRLAYDFLSELTTFVSKQSKIKKKACSFWFSYSTVSHCSARFYSLLFHIQNQISALIPPLPSLCTYHFCSCSHFLR